MRPTHIRWLAFHNWHWSLMLGQNTKRIGTWPERRIYQVPGVSPRARFPRPFRPPSVRRGVGFSGFQGSRGFTPGFTPAALQAGREREGIFPGVSSRARFPRPFRPPSVRRGVGFSGFQGSRGFNPGFTPAALQAGREREGIFPGVSSRARFPRSFRPPSVRRGVGFSGFQGSRGFTPGFTPAALQAGREREGIFPGVSSRCDSRGLSGRRRCVRVSGSRGFRVPGVSPRALLPRPYRPAESGRAYSPGFHPGLDSRGLSGRRRCVEVSGSRGFRVPGVSTRALLPRPFRPAESGRALFPGVSPRA